MKPGEDIDRAAIEAHAQRVAEQTALRKVRKALDRMREAESGERRILRKILVACAILAALGLGFLGWLLASGKDAPKGPPMQVPAALPPKQ